MSSRALQVHWRTELPVIACFKMVTSTPSFIEQSIQEAQGKLGQAPLDEYEAINVLNPH